MIHRLYVHNFRSLENFTLDLKGYSSCVLIGRNGSGKSTVMAALRVLQKAAQGTNRVKELVSLSDLTRTERSVPMRFEISAELRGQLFTYVLALELPDDFREMRIKEERLVVDRQVIYTRDVERISIAKGNGQSEATFAMDWHNVALPVIHGPGPAHQDAISRFKGWLGNMLLLKPIPSMIVGESVGSTLQPSESLMDLGSWFTGIMAHTPAAYMRLDGYLKQVMTDFEEIQNRILSGESRLLRLLFSDNQARISFDFTSLSDGEKCFVIAGLVIAAQAAYGPLFCFWDEPDSYLALSEVGHFVMNLRKTFKAGGQFVATSHSPEAIRRFSKENTFLLERRSHLEPTSIRKVDDFEGDLVDALLTNEIAT